MKRIRVRMRSRKARMGRAVSRYAMRVGWAGLEVVLSIIGLGSGFVRVVRCRSWWVCGLRGGRGEMD